MQDEGESGLRIDIVSDVVCPWCIIGYRQLARAMDETGIHAAIHWHPFELNPDMPEEGENLRDHVGRKYGLDREASEKGRRTLTALGADLGFVFAFTDAFRIVSTFRAHQILAWAETFGLTHEMKMALFVAYFSHGRDLNDPGVLVTEATALGLDRDEAQAILADGRYAEGVRRAEHVWTAHGIHGVPAMIFNRRHLVSGAQGVETYGRILRHLIDVDPVGEART